MSGDLSHYSLSGGNVGSMVLLEETEETFVKEHAVKSGDGLIGTSVALVSLQVDGFELSRARLANQIYSFVATLRSVKSFFQMNKSAGYDVKNLQTVVISQQHKWEVLHAEAGHLKHFKVAAVRAA